MVAARPFPSPPHFACARSGNGRQTTTADWVDATTFSLPAAMAARAAFFARLHNMPDAESWLRQIIQERLVFEESAFSDIKRVMEERASYKT